jgi:UDP-2,3-diacylglucosamine pyrophosphatase LpxH
VIQPLLDNALRKALKISLEEHTKVVFISDLHKGDNSYADDFKKNMRIYKSALHHYYLNDYTYIELGDGIELWENKKIKPILEAHAQVFDMLKEFAERNKLFLVYGNHDMVLQIPFMAKRLLGGIIPEVKYYESILLHAENQGSLLALHGHQADYLNYLFWWFFRFMVRYVLKPLQLL